MTNSIQNAQSKNLPNIISLGKNIKLLFLMATDIEYRDQLKKLFVPTIIGVGPVEAAINTAQALEKCPLKPTHVILVGSAGSPSLEQGAVYQASTVSYRDMDASAIGFAKGLTPFLNQPAHMPLDPQFGALPHATLATGASIVAAEQFDDIDADMVDMESFAVARVCQTHAIPLIVLRGISDGVKHIRKYDDWTELLPIVDANLANAVKIVLKALSAQET